MARAIALHRDRRFSRDSLQIRSVGQNRSPPYRSCGSDPLPILTTYGKECFPLIAPQTSILLLNCSDNMSGQIRAQGCLEATHKVQLATLRLTLEIVIYFTARCGRVVVISCLIWRARLTRHTINGRWPATHAGDHTPRLFSCRSVQGPGFPDPLIT